MQARAMVAGLLALFLATSMAWAGDDFQTIFDGETTQDWTTNTGKAVPKANIQPDGLNPHRSGGYLVVYEKPLKDFVLDFDYKLTPGCNSGVFIRVGDLKQPVMTGLEVAIDDTKGTGYHDTGALYDLQAPRVNAQKPAGEWNHMRITAKGPIVNVMLNGQEVNSVDLSQFDKPGQRPDGSSHKFEGVAIKDLARAGYFGFQDHGSDCWYKNIRLQPLD